MDIEKIKQFENYYLDAKVLQEYDLEVMKSNSNEFIRLIKWNEYDINDYFAFDSLCEAIMSQRKKYYYSRKCNVLKYKDERKKEAYIRFSYKEDCLVFDPDKHYIQIDDYRFDLYSPLEYNIFVLLLMSREKQKEEGENNPKRIDQEWLSQLPEMRITARLETFYGLKNNIESRLPLTVGFGSYRVLDRYMIGPKEKNENPQKGILCFYYGEYGGPSHAITERQSVLYNININIYDGPYCYGDDYNSYLDYRQVFRLSSHIYSEYKIFADEGNYRIYVAYITKQEYSEFHEITLYSISDYYKVGSWLIVTLGRFHHRNHRIHEMWPSYNPVNNIENSLSKELNVDYNRAIEETVRQLRESYDSVLKVLSGTSGIFAKDAKATETDLKNCLYSDLSYVSLAYSYNELAGEIIRKLYFQMTGKMLNTDLITLTKTDSDLLNKLLYFDIIFSVASKSETMTISDAIIKFYDIYQSKVSELLSNILGIDSNHESRKSIIAKWLEAIKQNNMLFGSAINQNVNRQDDKKRDDPEKKVGNINVRNDSERNDNLSDIKVNGLQMLDSLVGLNSIKSDVKSLIDFVKIQKIRKEKGISVVPLSLHLVFSGNPGTGKTTVARILGQLYKEIGVLKKGHVVEVDRSSLVAGYVGQTAIKTKEKINDAMGGILFIDEAYTLAKGDGNDFGQEAIDTLLKEMEDHRDEFIVIVAGYTDQMLTFINSNPGLKSRFNKYFHFPDYSVAELYEILVSMFNKYGFVVEEDALKLSFDMISGMVDKKNEQFANAREIRNFFESIISKQATRIARIPNPSEMELRLISIRDII